MELVNSTRTVAHLGVETPTSDIGLFGDTDRALDEDPPGSGLYIPDSAEDPVDAGLYDVVQYDMVLDEAPPGSGLYLTGECQLHPSNTEGFFEIPGTSEEIFFLDDPDAVPFYTPPDGSARFSRGLIQVNDGCWITPRTCGTCRLEVNYDDSWPELRQFLVDDTYRTELAPWYSLRVPESADFAGIWLMDVKGLNSTPVQRTITEMIGSGGVAGPHRDMSRTITFDALLVACNTAGLEYGLDWLTCRLRETTSGSRSRLTYLNSHPSYSKVDVENLLREAHGVVLTKAPEVTAALSDGSRPHQQATMYRVTWEMVATTPYVYMPAFTYVAQWDELLVQPIEWVHAADCRQPQSCDTMPVVFSTDCVPETIEVVNSPPPSCGGCMPLCELHTHVYHLPTLDYPVRCRETAVSMGIMNTGSSPLTFQAYWQACNTDIRCEDHLFPLQVSGLPSTAMLIMDAIEGRYWVESRGITDGASVNGQIKAAGVFEVITSDIIPPKKYRPVGIVGTPTGAPWRPTVLDREGCWQLVVVTPSTTNFNDFLVVVSMSDREP